MGRYGGDSSLITHHSSLGLLADDLTGALDAGAGFVRSRLRAVLPFSGRPEDAPDADVVLTGTPAGVGPMTDGQTVSVTIEGIGTLTNKVAAV